MNIQTVINQDICFVEISGEIIINNALEAKNEISNQIHTLKDKCKHIHLNLSKVDEFDSAGFQLLVALKKQCDQLAIDLTIDDISEQVKNVFELYHWQI